MCTSLKSQNSLEICRRELSETCIFDLPEEDITYGHILPHLSLVDVLRIHDLPETRILIEGYLRSKKCLTREEVADLSRHDLRRVAAMTQKLQKLDLSDCSALVEETALKIVKNNPGLTEVNFSSNPNLTARCLHSLIFCRNLRILRLRNNIWIPMECILTLLHHLNKLQILDINGCSQLNERSVSRYCIMNGILVNLAS